MTLTADVSVIFAAARQVHADALERLAQGDIRDAAEKAWLATLRATNALIMAHTGEEPLKTPPDSSIQLDTLAQKRQAASSQPSGGALLLQAEFAFTATASTSASVNPVRRLSGASARRRSTSRTQRRWPIPKPAVAEEPARPRLVTARGLRLCRLQPQVPAEIRRLGT